MDKENLKQMFLMQQTYSTLFAVTNKLQVYGDKNFSKMTSRQFMTLLSIAHIEEEPSLSNIARKLGTTKQSVKQILMNLEKQKYILISSSSSDKRKLQVTITDLGKSIMEDYYEVGKGVLASWFHDFSNDELEQFFEYLKRLYHFDGEYHDGFEKEIKQ